MRRPKLDKDITMTIFSYSITSPARFSRSLAIATLLGGTMLTGLLTSAHADTIGSAAFQLAQATTPQTQAGAAATTSKGETVEQRITALHSALKITSDEDAKWKSVAQAMRENASAMDKLVAESRVKAPQSMTAVEDLETYQKFSQAHVDGLKNLIASFSSLYSAMPDDQKKIADTVFHSTHETAAAHG
jgi:protein CpxP